jgi:SAM-dependent methyltransferase
VGCGIGDDARALVKRVAPSGQVIGLDASEEMIAKATAAGVSPRLRFAVADAATLPLADASCDAVRADRMLQHVEEPLRALLEMRRVLKPGGRLVIVEPDWKTMALYPGSGAGGDDDRAARAIFEWHVAHTRHPLIGRQLRALLDEAAFGSIAVNPVAYSTTRFLEADLALELTRAAEGAARQWPDRLSLNEARAWRTTARAADAASHFFASVPLYFGYALAE